MTNDISSIEYVPLSDLHQFAVKDFVIGFAVFFIVAAVIGQVNHKKKFGKWMKPGMQFMISMRGWLAFLKSCVGVPVPILFVGRADPSYINLTRPTFDEVSGRVLARMKLEGITYKQFYVDDFFDCVEFGRCFVDYFAQDMRSNSLWVKGKGCPVAVYVFKEKKRGGHACIAVMIEGELEYYEPYPEHFRKLDLDVEEIRTMRPVGF